MTTKAKKKAKTFILHNIDVASIDQQYGFELYSNISADPEIPVQSTHIDALTTKKKPVFLSFLEESKKYNITMIDSITTRNIQSGHCFWCRHTFDTVPIGCPLKYVPSKILKNCRSEITKERYTLCQHITSSNRAQCTDTDLIVQYKEYYETDGIFCSFNCCMAFIQDHFYDSRYKNSKNLLSKMYTDIFGSLNQIIVPAPSWRLLKDYGGYMDIDDFRKSFGNNIYIDKGCFVKNIPTDKKTSINLRPIGHVYEETFIF